MDIRLLKR